MGSRSVQGDRMPSTVGERLIHDDPAIKHRGAGHQPLDILGVLLDLVWMKEGTVRPTDHADAARLRAAFDIPAAD